MFIDSAPRLKDKRRVVRSVKDKLHKQHMVSVAEMGDSGDLEPGSLGLAAVSADGAYLRGVLDAIIRKLKDLPEGRLGDAAADVVDVADVVAFNDDDGTPLWTEAERRDEAAENRAA